MPEEDFKLKYSFLKDIYIELDHYDFFHSPSSVDKIDNRFRGRKKIENKLFNILNKSTSKSGAYLITGYRGVGKTSLVNKVLSSLVYKKGLRFKFFDLINKSLLILKKPSKVKKRYNKLLIWLIDKNEKLKKKTKKSTAPIVIRINLGHDELKEKDILNLIAKSLHKEYLSRNSRWFRVVFRFLTYTSLYISFLGILLFYGKMKYPKVGWEENLDKLFIGLDYTVYKIAFFENYKLLIDFSFLLMLLILFYIAFRWLITVAFRRRFHTDESAIKQLKFLNQRIDSYVTNEDDISLKSSNLGFKINNKFSYTIAGSRDIEIALIDIFEYIEGVGKIFGIRLFKEPKMIFVFDELDKIQPNKNSTITEKEGVMEGESKFSTSAEVTRKRQKRTSEILANLKHFFSTARAKFIFIAGREMYDATLADISDRNYFLGSIFHDIIYVNSFLTEDPEVLYKSTDESINDISHTSYYHSMAEEFLCQFLMPESFPYKDKESGETLIARLDNPEADKFNEKRMSISLKTYNIYLYEHSSLDDFEREKVILLLNQFITYLLHRSSGSPKKLTHLLERYICKNTKVLSTKNGSYREIRFLIAEETKEDEEQERTKLFLHFDYYSQHTFGLINYLTIPYYYNVSRHVKRYNDKLMVSTSYLIDHLYKFHDFGFSWRNLEVTPEIIDVNKAPTLRKLIEDIVGFLSITHLQHVVSGLYDFKFKKKISYEINFLSKISEREAAALNFTLDESHEVKAHFYKKLEKLSKDYEKTPSSEYIHSIGFLQQSLGDLYYYDQEYDDASVIYKDAIQYIRSNRENKKISLRIVVVLTRIMLKMGLSFERKKAYTSAYMAYCELSNLIMESLEIELSKIGLTKNLEDDGQVYVYKTKTFYRDKIEEARVNYFEEIFKQPLYSESHNRILKGSVTETVRLLYQPFIAKLHVQDKEKIGGVTRKDIKLALKEIAFLTKAANPIIEKKISSEYHNKIADFLFFSNYSFKNFSARKLYLKALKLFIQSQGKNIKIKNSTSIINLIFKYLVEGTDKRFSFEELKMIASNLSDYGDSLLSGIKNSNFEVDSIEIVNLIVTNPNDIIALKDDVRKVFNFGGLNSVIVIYSLSYIFYFRNDDHSKAAFQIIKILHTLEIDRDELSVEMLNSKGNKIQFFKEIKEVVNRVLYSIYRSYNSSTRQEMERMKEIFKITEENINKKFHLLLNNLPSISEVQEVLMVYRSFEIGSEMTIPEDNNDLIYKYLNRYNPSIYSDFSGMYGRLNNLYIKTRANFEVFHKVKEYNVYFERTEDLYQFRYNRRLEGHWEGKDGFKKIEEEDHILIKYIISDTIYCFTEMVRILKTFGETYITNHSTFGFVYNRRSSWCDFFEDYDYVEREMLKKKAEEKKNYKLYTIVRNLIGSQAMSNLKPRYNLEKAISHYVQAIETHKGKFAYKRMIENMHYLDNDFNDNHLHFFAALERYKIQVQDIQEKIDECKRQLNASRIYDIERYTDIDLI